MSQEKNHFPRIEKSAMREITNSSKNKLANRLFRNSSLNHFNPNVSMLSSSAHEASFLNTSASNSQLVASISLRKFKNKTDNEPYLSICNGKVLINTTNSPKESKKQLFKKLDKLQHDSYTRILPDDLIDFTIEKQDVQPTKLTKKSSASSLKPKKGKNKFMNGKEDLLPEDFIQMLEQDKTITNEFCYLKKMDHPYDLKIIEFDQNLEKSPDTQVVQYPSEYITISSRGVTYFSQDQSRFVTLQEWKKQANYFKKIIKLDFFKNFKVIKNFSNWKKCLRKSAMKSTIENLKQQLVYNDLYLSRSLLKVREICYTMETDTSYCRFDDCQKAMDIKKFRAAHQAFLDNEFRKKISRLEENIKEVLINSMSLSMKQFKQQNKISSSIEGKGMPLLIGDEKNLEMPYTKEATLRTQQQKFQKFIKLVDIIITHSKVNMMAESTNFIARKIQQQNQFYDKQIVQSNYKNTFKGDQYLECILTLDLKEQELFLRPTKKDLFSLFEDIVSRSVVRICRYHRKISSDIDVLSIIYDNQDQFPKQSQSENLKAIMTSDNRQDQMINTIMEPISISYDYILKYIQRFKKEAKTHFQNLVKLQEIEYIEPKDHETIKLYLQEWQKQKQFLNTQIPNEHEGPLFELSLRQFKQQIERSTDDCIKQAKITIPRILEYSTNNLLEQLVKVNDQINVKPVDIEQLIQLSLYLENIDDDIEEYKTQKGEIEALEKLVTNFANTESNYRKSKGLLETTLGLLRTNVPKAKKTLQVEKNTAKADVDNLKKNVKLSSIYDAIVRISQQAQNVKSTKQMNLFITESRFQLQKMIEQFEKIVTYEKFLNLPESDPIEIECFKQFFNVYEKIWATLHEFQVFFAQLQEKKCATVQTSEVYSKLQEFINIFANLIKQIKASKEKDSKFQFFQRDHISLNQSLQQAERIIRPLVDTIECLNETVLGQKEWKQARVYLQAKNKQVLRLLQMDKNERTVNDLLKYEAPGELNFLKAIALKAKNNNEVSKKFQIVKSFTNFPKSHPSIFKNLTDKFRTYFGDFIQEVDEKILMINFVLQQSENREYEKAKQQKNTLEKLRYILILWDQYEQHVQYFEPLVTLTDCKGIQDFTKSFNQATEQNWKKTSKSCKDLNLNKVLANQRIIPSLKQSNQLLETLYPACRAYFYSKRLATPRLCFVSDHEITKIQAQCKDLRNINIYINRLYPSVRQLVFKEEQLIPNSVKNVDGETLPLKNKISGTEVDQIFKSIDQVFKSSIKASLRQCITSYEIETFNKLDWIKLNNLQSLVFTTNNFFTSIIQQDYLSPNGDDLSKLYNYHLSQIMGLKQMINQPSIQSIKKMLVLLTQQILIRDIIQYLITERIESKESYGWLKQIRSYNYSENATNQYLNHPVPYGYEFVSLESNPLLLTGMNQKAMIEMVNTMICCHNVPVVSKSFLPQLAAFNGKTYNYVCLVSGEERSILQNIVQGTWLTGSFTDLQVSNQVSLQQFEVMARALQQIQLAISLNEPVLRGFKNFVINRDAGISLICPNFASSPLVCHRKIDYRIIENQQISWSAYMDLLFEVYQLSYHNMARKIARVINYLQNSISSLSFCRKQMKNLIEQIANQKINENAIARMLLKRIYKKKISVYEKKFISKVFFQVFGVQNNEKLLSYKSIRDINMTEQQINKLMAIFKENKVCVIVGQNSQFREHIAREVQRNYCGEGIDPKLIVFHQEDLSDLFGSFKENRWVDGTLNSKMKKSVSQRECFILVGKCSPNIIFALQRLDSKINSYMNLENGQKIKLGSEQRIIFMCENSINDSILKDSSLKIYDFDSIRYSPEEILDYLVKIKINKHSTLTLQGEHFIDKSESLALLQNIYLNNLQKIGNSSLKMIGYKSEFNEPNIIMTRFVTILSSVLVKDKDKSCVQNTKMMERLYIWSIFWAIGSSIPKRNIERLDKLFDSIKIDYDKSQSLSQTEFAVSKNNLTVCKLIKTQVEFVNKNKDRILISPQMLGKKQLIRLLVMKNNHILLVGERNSGKSCYLEYLQSELLADNYSIVKTKINIKTTKDDFLSWLRPSICIQYFPNNADCKYAMCSKNGKKLVVVVDNFNLIDCESQLFQFFGTVTNYQYYNDALTNDRISIGDICFVCSTTGSFEAMGKENNFLLRQFFPIYINSPDLSDVMALYSNQLQSRFQNKAKNQLMHKVVDSIVGVHTTVTNVILSEPTSQPRFLSLSTPIWIAKEIINRVSDENYGPSEIISLWKYLSVKLYAQTVYMTGFKQQIEHQLINLVSLMVKKPDESKQFLKSETQLVQELYKAQPLLRLVYDESNYYCYLTYILRSKQPRHIIAYSRTTVPLMRAQAINSICESLQIKFQHIKDLGELHLLDRRQNTVVFVDERNQALVDEAFAIIQNATHCATFIIDVKDIQMVSYYMRFYPSTQKAIHIFEDEPTTTSPATISIENYQIISQILHYSKLEPKSQQYANLFWNISETIDAEWAKISPKLTQKTSELENAVNNLNELGKNVQQLLFKIQGMEKGITQLNKQLQQLLDRKNEGNLKKDQLNQIQTELKKIKLNRKESSEEIAKIKETSSEKLDAYKIIRKVQLSETCLSQNLVCNQLKKKHKLQYFKIIHCLVSLYLKSYANEEFQMLLLYANKWSQENLGVNLAKLYSILLSIQIKDIRLDSQVLKWVFSGYKTVLLTNYPSKLVEKLQSVNHEAKECHSHFELNQLGTQKPLLTTNKQLMSGTQNLSLISKPDSESDKAQINYEPSPQEVNAEFEDKVLNEICRPIREVQMLQLATLDSQRRRFMVEARILKQKLLNKVYIQKPQPNFLSELKQIAEGILAIENRISVGINRIQQIQASIRAKYGQVIDCVGSLKEFLKVIGKKYEYAIFSDKYFIQIVFSSLIFKEVQPNQPENQNNESNQQVSAIKTLEINETIKNLQHKICQWVILSLKPIDCVNSYFLFACWSLKNNKTISKSQYEGIKKIIIEEVNQIKVKLDDSLNQVLTSFTQNAQNKLDLAIEFSEKILNLDFHMMLNKKQEWIESTQNIFNHPKITGDNLPAQLKKIFIVLRSMDYNAYKIINRQIKKYHPNEQNLLFLQKNEIVQHRIQLLEKSQQHCWIVMDNWTDPSKVNRMIQYISKSKCYQAVLLFNGAGEFLKIKQKLVNYDYHQVYLHDRTIGACQQVKRILEVHELSNASAQVNKLAKFMAADHISRLAKGLIQPAKKFTNYCYRIFERLSAKSSSLDLYSLVKFAIDFFYDPACQSDRVFLKEANKSFKSTYKMEIFPEIFDDNTVCQYYSLFLDNFQNLKEKNGRQRKLKTYLNSILPEQISCLITTDLLLNFNQIPAKTILKPQTVKIIHKELLQSLNEILQKVPILVKQQQNEKIHPFYIEILREQKKNLELHYTQKIQKVKKLIKTIESKRSNTYATQNQIIAVSKHKNALLDYLLNTHSKIMGLQKKIDGKQPLNIISCLSQVSRPQNFMHVYMFQSQNLGRVDWTLFGLHIRCMTDKEKQSLKDAIEKNECIPLTNLKIKNAKFESHKHFIESVTKGEVSKLANIYVYIGKEENQPYSRRVPLMINKTKIDEIAITSKTKQLGYWGPEISAFFCFE